MSNDAFYLCDSHGRFLYVNDRAVTMGGYTPEEMRHMSVPDINPDFPAERYHDYVDAMVAGTAPTQFETISRAKDGRLFPIEISVAIIVVDGERYLFGVVRDITERKQIEATQKSFTQRMLQTLEAERQRVARELHDDVGQALATVGVLLHTLGRALGIVPEDARTTLTAARATVGQITESVARIVRDYHPADLLGLGLEDTVRSHAREFAVRHRLALRLVTAPVSGLLTPEHELHLYRIAQEALANVARHARATRVAVRLGCDRRSVTLTIRDDGVGFSPANARAPGLGLVTMGERAELMRARLEISSAPGRGATIRVTVPIAAQAGARASAHRRASA